MKRFSIKLISLLTAMTMLLAGCSESNSTGDPEKNSSSQSSSQQDDSSSGDNSSSEDSSSGEGSGGSTGEQTTADVIPWDYVVPDPSGNTSSPDGNGDSSDQSTPDTGESSSQGSSDSSSNSNPDTITTTKASDGATTTMTSKTQSTQQKPANTTTTTKTTAAPAPAPTSGTPVQRHGALHISGNHIVDSHGKVFMLQGMSTHGIMWEDYSNILSANSLKVLRDDWKCNAIRIAMYTEEWGGYTTGSNYAAQAKQKVINGVANATNLGMYVIIDWHILHDGNPQTHQSEAIAFFTEMANRYKNYNNVIFEICNEPNGGVTWSSNIKPYCQAVVNAIRKTGANNLIICGTGTWSQDIDQVVNNRLSDANCAYTLHFYANTHTDWLRQRLQSCYNSGLPVLVTEFGTCDASGNGGFNEGQTRQWYNLLANLKVGWFNWSASSKNETASAFKPGTNLSNISAGESQLTQSGKLIRNLFRANAANAA